MSWEIDRFYDFCNGDYESKLAKNIKKDGWSVFRYVGGKSESYDLVGPLIDNSGKVVLDEMQQQEYKMTALYLYSQRKT